MKQVILGEGSRSKLPAKKRQPCCYAYEHSENLKSQYEELPQYLDLICFSHIRWDLVYQRPQHLMSRWAKTRRVYFFEEPVIEPGANFLEVSERNHAVTLITPHLSPEADRNLVQQKLLSDFIDRQKIRDYLTWYISPMFLPFTSHLNPKFTVYDCMDELSGFAGAPSGLREAEGELFTIADLVFTGGLSLYEAKCKLHQNIHAFPSSIDFEHFSQGRFENKDPIDQRDIPGPRIGYYGVIDERMDQQLVDAVAERRPDWHWIFVGPVLKVDPDKLPQRDNIHYLGKKDYKNLPSYLGGWDVAVLPFARNDATRFISPTKTPEYLAAGKPVVSTSIHDVVRPYGERGLVSIADEPEEFIAAIEKSLSYGSDWLKKVDAFLLNLSWDQTWNRMNHLLAESLNNLRESEHSIATSTLSQEDAHV